MCRILADFLERVEDRLFPHFLERVANRKLGPDILNRLFQRGELTRVQCQNARDIAGRQPVALAHRDPRGDRLQCHDRRLPVGRERVRRVVHDGAVVVGTEIVAVAHVLGEVVLQRRIDVRPNDTHEGVAILPALFVPQADGVADLMDCVAGAAALAQCDRLLSAAVADLR